MSDYVTPCAAPENDPDDWFITKYGRQYRDDDLLTQEQMDAISNAVMAKAALDDTVTIERAREMADEAIDLAEQQALKTALVRRRHAKDKCHTECYLRTQCLGLALAPGAAPHGTWGGYYEEELQEIRDLRDARQARAAVGSEE